jgi:hypothetical protein
MADLESDVCAQQCSGKAEREVVSLPRGLISDPIGYSRYRYTGIVRGTCRMGVTSVLTLCKNIASPNDSRQSVHGS